MVKLTALALVSYGSFLSISSPSDCGRSFIFDRRARVDHTLGNICTSVLMNSLCNDTCRGAFGLGDSISVRVCANGMTARGDCTHFSYSSRNNRVSGC